ncbi:MAG: 2-oxo acid dehydrogenase subunit E2 [Phycisphaeraceae bacterium]|nr:2-oxo acid dehydrogenase subunit E2 [Phycisphaeraceae bacterium]
MAIEIKMPRLSDTMEQGTIVKWSVKPGQKVAAGDVIADIETDKATMELQTFDEGTVGELVVAEGQQVPVGTVIMTLTGAEEPAGKPAPSAAAGSPAPASAARSGSSTSTSTVATTPKAAPAPAGTNGHHASPVSGERVFASPLARKIADESGIDLGAIHGTGPSGRIVRKDVEAALGGRSEVARHSVPGDLVARHSVPGVSGREPAKISGLSAGAVPGVAMPPTAPALAAKKVALSNMRQTIAKRLVQSKATIPHYQVTVTVRMDALLALRGQLNDQLASQGVKLSVNDFLVRACALAMHQHPFINARWSEGQGSGGGQPSIDIVPDVNIGVAIALPVNPETLVGGGLVVATLRNADRMGLRQISADTKRLSEKARAKGLSIDEMSDSTFTISNLGMFGVEHFTAIINPPNAAILAVGAAVEKPVVGKDAGGGGEKKLVIGTEMQMTMSSDHRIIDGAMAAAYLATVKEFLEKPATLLV